MKWIVAKYIELEEEVLNLKKYSQIALSNHSASIEGSSLTFNEARILIEDGKAAGGKEMIHYKMEQDHFNALNHVLALAKNKKELYLEDIQKISSIIMKQTGTYVKAPAGNFDVSKGELRRCSVRAGKRQFMPFEQVEDSLKLFLKELNQNLSLVNSIENKYELSFIAHYDLVNIHPFADGNGRLSRLLMNYVQAYDDLPLSIVHKHSQNEYCQVLESSHKDGCLNKYLAFMKNQAVDFFKEQLDINDKSKIVKTKKDKESGMSFIF